MIQNMKVRYLLIAVVLCALFGKTANAQDWTLTNGPSGGKVRSILVDGTELYVVGRTVLRSTNLGASWNQLPMPYSSGTPKYISRQSDGDLYVFASYAERPDSVWKITIDSTGDTLRTLRYVGTSSDPSGLYRSTNKGQSWDHVLFRLNASALHIDANDRLMLAAESGYETQKLYTSTNDGATWDSSVTLPKYISGLHGDASGNYFLTTAGALYRSTTGGTSWSKILNGLPGGSSFYSFAEDVGGKHFTAQAGGTYMSSDKGRSWEVLKINDRYLGAPVARNASGMLLTGNSYDSLHWISADNGVTWNSVKSDGLALAFSGNDVQTYVPPTVGGASNDFYSGNAHGFWHISPSGLEEMSVPTGTVTALIALSTGTLIATTAYSDFNQDGSLAYWRSTNEGLSWSRLHSQEMLYYIAHHTALDSSGNAYMDMGMMIMRTSDDGLTWHYCGSALNSTASTTGIAVGPDGSIYVATDGEYMIRSTDNGLSWDQLNYGLPDPKLTSIAVSPNNDVYVSTEKKIFRSTDAGLNWSATAFSTPDAVAVLVVSPQGRILAGTKTGKVLSSVNNGASWMSAGSGLDSSVITRMLSTPSGKIIAGSDSGVYVLDSGSDVWRKLSDGLTNPSVLSLTRALDGRVYVGTAGTGVFKSSQTYNIIRSEVKQPSRTDFAVIRSSEGLRFTGLAAGSHEVTIVDVLGRTIIETTINSDTLKLSALSSGTYFVKIGDRVAAFTM
jgi:photosystem II stability/assembly factor-like uncharacterized protein